MITIPKALGFLVLSTVYFVSAAAVGGQEATKSVNCNKRSLQHVIDRSKPGTLIKVSGTCNELIDITTDNLTLDGRGKADISGAGIVSTLPLVRISGASNVTIKGFTIHNAPRNGLVVRRGGSAVITGNTISDNANNGILVHQSSSARVGSSRDNHALAGTPGSEGNVVENNGGDGIVIRTASSADMFHNIVRNNGLPANPSRGIFLEVGGSAFLSGNKITSNTDRGVHAATNASIRWSADAFHQEQNLIQLNGEGIVCRTGAAMSGNPQNFGVGNPGTGGTPHSDDTDISGTCAISGALGF